MTDDILVDLNAFDSDDDGRETYATAAMRWHDRGYTPLPVRDKGVTPFGSTGYKAPTPSLSMISEWIEYRANDDTCLRMARDQVGLDCDEYESKNHAAGEASKALAALPPLPLTWRVSSRFGEYYDGVSGVKMYRIPKHYASRADEAIWAGQVANCPAIELIRWAHRNVNCWPTWHVRGTQYGAMHEGTGEIIYGPLPHPSTLPELPEEWCELLLKPEHRKDYVPPVSSPNGRKSPVSGALRVVGASADPEPSTDTPRSSAGLPAAESVYWTPGELCPAVDNVLGRWLLQLPSQRHKTALEGVLALSRAGEQGHQGVRRAVETMFGGYIESSTADGTRSVAVATAEWERMITGIDAIIAATPTSSDDQGCCPELVPVAGGVLVNRLTWENVLGREASRETALEILDRARQPPPREPDVGTLREILARPLEPEARATGIIPWYANTLASAQRKTGKTTWAMGCSKSLITGEPLLGVFDVRPIESGAKVAILNFELPSGQLGRWAKESGLDPDRFYIENWRSRGNPFLRPESRAEMASRIVAQNTESLFLDTFAAAYTGKNQNDPGEVRAWLEELSRWAREDAGVRDLIVTVHAGWLEGRTRGASALEDWPDSIIRLSKDEKTGQRFLSAIGRDVDVPEDALLYDPVTRAMTLSGTGGRITAKAAAKPSASTRGHALSPLVVAQVAAEPGLNRRGLETAFRAMHKDETFATGAFDVAIKVAVDAGQIQIQPGTNNQRLHYPANDSSVPSISTP